MIEKNQIDSLTLWDSNLEPPAEAGLVYCWNGYMENDSVFSILKYVDINDKHLRKKYLAWIHDIGAMKVNGKRLIDHLTYEEGLSYWWLTLFSEQSPWMTPEIVDVIRLFATEEILAREKPTKLVFVSSNRKLHAVIYRLCRKLDIDYTWKKSPVKPFLFNLKDILVIFPYPLQALISISRHIYSLWPLRRIKRPKWFVGNNSVSFFSYFIYLDRDSCNEGRFYSELWGKLPVFLRNSGVSVNWLHHFQKSAVVPDTSTAVDFVNNFNKKSENKGAHSFLYSYLTIPLLFRVLKKWVWLIIISIRLQKGIKPAFHPADSSLELWPLMEGVWCASLRGTPAVVNLLWIELFDVAMQDIPRQEKGLYLFESQAWERALIHAWHKHGHGELIAVAHSTVRFWDLRYYKDPRIIKSREPQSMPQPDITLVNGQAAFDSFLSEDYPKEKLIKCEALRYEYLYNQNAEKDDSDAVEVLILGDYMPSGTHRLLRLLEACQKNLPNNINYTLKPHPSNPVKLSEYSLLNLSITNKSLSSIISDYDIAYSSNMTSASVDAYLVGLPIIIMLDAYELNFSPLRGYSGVSFVSTSDELLIALSGLGSMDGSENLTVKRKDYFYLDPELPRWKELFVENDKAEKHDGLESII